MDFLPRSEAYWLFVSGSVPPNAYSHSITLAIVERRVLGVGVVACFIIYVFQLLDECSLWQCALHTLYHWC